MVANIGTFFFNFILNSMFSSFSQQISLNQKEMLTERWEDLFELKVLGSMLEELGNGNVPTTNRKLISLKVSMWCIVFGTFQAAEMVAKLFSNSEKFAYIYSANFTSSYTK